MDDKQIIKLYFDRDEAAIDETDKKYGKLCHSVALNLLGDLQDAEECLNDTYLAAWNKMPPENPNALSAFLVRLARNISISIFRLKRAKKRYSGFETLLSELDECIPAPCNTEQEVEGKELARLVNSWLDGQFDSDCAVFVKRYFYGRSVTEIADQFGVTPEKMSQKLFSLRKKLKAYLQREGVNI